jgi:hypothetical protein
MNYRAQQQTRLFVYQKQMPSHPAFVGISDHLANELLLEMATLEGELISTWKEDEDNHQQDSMEKFKEVRRN